MIEHVAHSVGNISFREGEQAQSQWIAVRVDDDLRGCNIRASAATNVMKPECDFIRWLAVAGKAT